MNVPGDDSRSGTWITTTTLLDRLHDYDDHLAWDRLVERFRRPISAFALEMGVAPRDADDVAQETLLAFAEALRAGKYDRTRGRLRSWLFGIAHRQSLAQKRRGARHALAPEKPELRSDEPRGTGAASRIWDRLWDRYLIEKAIQTARERSDPKAFRAFELVALADRAPPDVAAELGVPVKFVYNAKHRVASRVREHVRELESVATESPDGLS